MVTSTKRVRRLTDAHAFPGFRPQPTGRGVFGDPKARVISLVRRSKKRPVAVAVACSPVGTTGAHARRAICRAATGACTWFEVRRIHCKHCGTVKRERLEFLADNPFCTKRFAYYVGRRCRSATIKDIAEELRLDWDTVKALEKQYMAAQLAKAGTPRPTVIGIDELSIRKGQTYRIVVSDLIRERPIWFGGDDRSEASMGQFYAWLGPRKAAGIRLAVMDTWKPFRNAAATHAP